jgi:NAD(P)-dependent dehydrogenase (short-subunit alcohol dehydrogenase family)
MSGRVQGKTIAITGASSGLGRAMALRFAAEGAHVVCADVRGDPREGGEPTADVIAASGGSAEYVRADASRWDDIDRLVNTAVARSGRLDVMVNNAIVAGPHSKGLLETDEDDWDAIMAVGLRGVFLCCKRAVQQMLAQEPVAEARGRIINLVAARHDRRAGARRVLHGQGGRRQPHPPGGRRLRPAGDHRERHRAGQDPHPPRRRAGHARGARLLALADAVSAPGPAG